MAEILLLLAVGGFIALVLWAAISDIATMLIPNRIPVGLVILFALAAPMAGLSGADVLWHVGVAAAVFAVTVALFVLNIFGGGDAKLAPAIALWIGPQAVMDFLFHTALWGGLLGLFFLLARRICTPTEGERPAWIERLLKPDGGIPYAVALAAGAVAGFLRSPFAAVISF